MRKLLFLLLVALIAAAPVGNVRAQTQTNPATAAKPYDPVYPIVIGLGAIAGTVLFNVATGGLQTIPYLARTVPVSPTAAAAAQISMSRNVTVISAVIGAWVANWMYGH
ncbi:conserved membrane hypothetical protein [uncultured Gammaproteobacteria bacterium]